MQTIKQANRLREEKVNASINAKKGELTAKANELGDATADQAEYKAQLEEQNTTTVIFCSWLLLLL